MSEVNSNMNKHGNERRNAEDASKKIEKHDVPTRDSIIAYFSNIKKIPLLSAVEERDLAIKIAGGDRVARRKMIEANLRLIINIARRYINRGVPFEDLIEEGNIGLIMAVERFRADKGCRFSTYASFWIRQSVDRAVANQSNTIRVPVHVDNDLSRISRATRELARKLKREPSTAEISESTSFTDKYIKKLDLINKKCCSLESTASEWNDQPLSEKIEDDRTPGPAECMELTRRETRIGRWIGALDEYEKTIVKKRFGFDGGEPQTLEAIGNFFGVSRERIRQIEMKSLEKLKKMALGSGITSLVTI